MPLKHPETLHRLSFRVDEPTIKRLDRIAKIIASRDGFPVASRTQAIRFSAQVVEALMDKDSYDAILAIVRRLGVYDRSGAPALGEALKFAVKVVAKAESSGSASGGTQK